MIPVLLTLLSIIIPSEARWQPEHERAILQGKAAHDLRNTTALVQENHQRYPKISSSRFEETRVFSPIVQQEQEPQKLQKPKDTVVHETTESDANTIEQLLSSSSQTSSHGDGDPGETVVKVGESSGPFGVSLGDWALIIFIGLVTFVAVYVLRQYIKQVISILETSCYWTMKGIMYPFQLLFIGMRSLSYPVKEFCVYTYNATDEYYRPWKVVS